MRTRPDTERLRQIRAFHARLKAWAIYDMANLVYLQERLEEDEEWAIDQVLHTGSLSPEASTHSDYESPEHDYEIR